MDSYPNKKMFKLVFSKPAIIGQSKAEINNHKEMKKDE